MAWVGLLLCSNVNGQTATYTVKPGDSLSKIARSKGCTVESLAKANGIKLSAIIQAGQTLKLPGKTAAKTSDGGHIIQPGDTFSSISRQYGISVESLLAANPALNPKSLKPGQKILLAAASRSTAGKADPAQPAVTSENSVPSIVDSPADATPEASHADKPSGPSASPTQPSEEKVRTVQVDSELTFGEFAAEHGCDIQRLNELNGLDLAAATVLAKGSELYVPVRDQSESRR